MATKIEQDDWSGTSDHCPLAGGAAPEQRDVLIAYAREHLVAEIEAQGFQGLPVIDAGDPKPSVPYTQIRVEPRTHLGELDVTQCEPNGTGGCQWGSSIAYCLHVTTEGGKRIIIIERHASMIGARTARTTTIARATVLQKLTR